MASTLRRSPSHIHTHRAVLCVKRKVSVDPRWPSVYSAESCLISLGINAQRGTTIVPAVRQPENSTFYSLSLPLRVSLYPRNTRVRPQLLFLTLLLAGAFGRKKVQEQEGEDNSSGSEKTTAATATLSFQHLSPAECGSRSVPSVRTAERILTHTDPQRPLKKKQKNKKTTCLETFPALSLELCLHCEQLCISELREIRLHTCWIPSDSNCLFLVTMYITDHVEMIDPHGHDNKVNRLVLRQGATWRELKSA